MSAAAPVARRGYPDPAHFVVACVAAQFVLIGLAAETSCTAAQGKAAESALLAIDAVACQALIPLATPIPAAADSLACTGEEALLRMALDAATATSSPTTSPEAPRKAVYRPAAGKRKLVGFVPEAIAPACEAALCAMAVDGGT